MSLDRLKLFFGFMLLVILAALVCIIALGKVAKETSYGLDGLMTGLLLLTQQWASWCFGKSREREE